MYDKNEKIISTLIVLWAMSMNFFIATSCTIPKSSVYAS
jgi:hypothetical protein